MSQLSLKTIHVIVLIVIGLLLFVQASPNQFVWDDEEQILNNTLIQDLDNAPQFFFGSTFNGGGSGGLTGLYYKPLLTFVFAILYALFGAVALPFHLFQTVLHLVNTCLIYRLLNSYKLSAILAFGVSLIWMIHPVNVESVVYTAGLQEPLFMFFGLLALNYTSYSWPFLFLSLLSKETGLVMLALYFLQQTILTWYENKSRIARFITTGLYVGSVFVSYLILRFGIARMPLVEHELSPLNRLPLIERLVSVPAMVAHYLTTIVWPAKLVSAQHWVITEATFSNFVIPALIIIALLGLALWRIARLSSYRRPLAIFFLMGTLAGFLLHLHLLPLDFTVSDRWMYLPLFTLLGLIVSLTSSSWIEGLFRSPLKLGYVAFFVVVIIALLARSSLRIWDWRDSLSLYGADVPHASDSFDLVNNYGVALYRAGMVSESKEYFERSTKLAPYWWTNWNNLGAILESESSTESALTAYRTAIDNGHYYLSYENYARLLIIKGQFKEAFDFLTHEALPRYPQNPTLQQYLLYLRAQVSN